ncbi:MAG: formylglycine-generating enzyme family protein [Acidobacteria bacterium]|nr:formylglycine-generating enzyme family protein [Acidobacteriota bacterium]
MRWAFWLAATVPTWAAVDFARDIQPIFEKHCLSCHDELKSLGGLRLDNAFGLRKVVTPGQPESSRLYLVTQMAPTSRGAMPPGGPQISQTESGALKQWIAEGAVWPGGVFIGRKQPARPADDLALTERIHRKVVAAGTAKFERYKSVIPGSDVSFEMVPIPPGEFQLGTPTGERGRREDEGPQRRIRVEAFWMQAMEVTWDEYRLFMFAQKAEEKDGTVDAVSRPTRPYVEMSFGMGINGYPAISMTQHAANKYAQWLSSRTGHFYRLPTEAEWEYACRAGSADAYSFGANAAALGEYGWFADNANGKYQLTGKKKPNAFGLFDMHGNVTEWVLDGYDAAAYSKPDIWQRAAKPYPHVVRGGSWNDDAAACRCGARAASDPSWKMQDPQLPKSIWYHTDAQWVGFRLVRPVKVPPAAEMHAYWNSGVEKDF